LINFAFTQCNGRKTHQVKHAQVAEYRSPGDEYTGLTLQLGANLENAGATLLHRRRLSRFGGKALFREFFRLLKNNSGADVIVVSAEATLTFGLTLSPAALGQLAQHFFDGKIL
jgi:hypothetical protein